MLPHDARSPLEQNPWKLFRNASGETIPPFSVMRVTGAENTTNPTGAIRYVVSIPNTTFCREYLINGPYAVPAGDDGIGTTLAQSGYVAYNSGSGTPAYGDEWGAKAGQWTLDKGRPGFIIQGGIKFTAGVNAVVAAQREVTRLLAINREDMDQGQTCPVDVYFRDIANNKWRKSEYLIPAVYDWFLNDGETIEKDTKLVIGWHAVWTIIGAYCSPTDLEEFLPPPDIAAAYLGELEALLQQLANSLLQEFPYESRIPDNYRLDYVVADSDVVGNFTPGQSIPLRS